MLVKQTIVDRIEIMRDGTIQVRRKKCIIDSEAPDVPLTQEYHRTSFPPGIDYDGQIALVEAHLAEMGAGAIPDGEWDRLKGAIELVHTPQVVEAYRAKMTAQLDASNEGARPPSVSR